MYIEKDTNSEIGEKITTTEELESLIEEASNFLRLKPGISASWIFTDWQDNKRETVIAKDKQGKEVKRYLRITFYNVIDIMSKDQRPKTFATTSIGLLRKLFYYFEQHATCLEITKTGEGTNTDYDIYPITPTKEQDNQE